ncbi:: DUF3168 [Gemmata massiliana]|uniref:: DUF3168 n=1 Tax=Gemmata massiliana TaxID=1210884 RepID=A0A6P2D293_9BACT|nr:DUF3168 domain-containing protein [Gemmata massiliana]VTR95223.1 : DUF3168 [Gemmata massiliana]
MPSIQETLYSALASDAVLTALVDDRIYPGQIPDDETPSPWLMYQVPEANPFDDLDGGSDTQLQIEFHALADSYAEAKAIVDAVSAVLHAYTGGQISRAFWNGTSEESTELGYHHVARFDVWGTSATVIAQPGANARITTGLNSIELRAGAHVLTLDAGGLLLDGTPVGAGGASVGNLDGGTASSVYGGLEPIDGGGA